MYVAYKACQAPQILHTLQIDSKPGLSTRFLLAGLATLELMCVDRSVSNCTYYYIRVKRALAYRRTVAQSLTKMAKNPQFFFFEIYHFYYVFCFPVMCDDLPKQF